jgi:hypothetical protein
VEETFKKEWKEEIPSVLKEKKGVKNETKGVK